MVKWLFAVGLTTALAVSTASCSSGSSPSSSGSTSGVGASSGSDSGRAKPRSGGTLVAAQVSIVSNMAPTQVSVSWSGAGLTAGAIYGYLGYIDPKSHKVELQFLKSITPSKDLKVWTLVLNSGIRFSDGTPLDAAAIKYTLDKKADPNQGDSSQQKVAAWKAEVVDEITLKITLPEANSGFAAEMTQVFPYIASPTAWNKDGDKFGANPVGAGPFKLESWTQNNQMTLVRNPLYKEFAAGQPYLDKIVVKVTSTPNQQIAAFRSGEASAGWLQQTAQFKQARAAGMNVVSLKGGGGLSLIFNTARAPFNDLRARQAVTYALNSKQLASVWIGPGADTWTNVFPTSSPYYDKSGELPKTNPEKAKQLFNELRADGIDMNIKFITTSSYPQIAEYVQATLGKYPGVQVSIDTPLVSDWRSAAQGGEFDMSTYGLTYAVPGPEFRENLGKDGGSNYGKWNDPKVNRALSAIGRTLDESVWAENFKIIAREFATQLPMFPAQSLYLGFATAKNIKGVELIQGGGMPLPALLWIEK